MNQELIIKYQKLLNDINKNGGMENNSNVPILEEFIDPDILNLLRLVLDKFELYIDLREFGYTNYSVPKNLVGNPTEYEGLEELRKLREMDASLKFLKELRKSGSVKVIPLKNSSLDMRLSAVLEVPDNKEFIVIKIFDGITKEQLAVIKIAKSDSKYNVFMRYLGELINDSGTVYEVDETTSSKGRVEQINISTYFNDPKVDLNSTILNDTIESTSADISDGMENINLGFDPKRILELSKYER